ncbi:MAG: anti-sigma factor [Thermoleophilia bacterium]|nr:anti-sigma factor [Thermoleophilia bacterium]
MTFEKNNRDKERKSEAKAHILPEEHVDQWQEVAVDYLDGRLDPATTADVEAHLLSCPDCARRLDEQRRLVNRLRQVPAAEPPVWLEEAVLKQVLLTPALEQQVKPARAKEPAWTRFWRGTLRPWAPAAIAVAAILVGIVSYGILQGTAQETVSRFAQEAAPSGSEQVASSLAVSQSDQAAGTSIKAAAPGTSGQEDTSAGILAGQEPQVTTTAVAATATASSLSTDATSASVSAPTMYTTEEPRVDKVTVENKSRIVETLQLADIPAHFVYTSTSLEETAIQRKAWAVATQFSSLTGLEPLAVSLSPSGPTLAAYLPRDDAAPFVDLLLSIGASLELSLSLEFQPPETQSEAYNTIMEHKADLAELVARRAPSPGISGWTFTTSTSIAPEQRQADALVIIFVRQ